MAMNDKPALALLSGLLCDAAIWQDVADDLGDVAQVTIIDFPGFDSIPAMADKVLATMPERFWLAGHSMGGRVALEVLRRAPDRVEKLVLLDTGIHPTGAHEPATRGKLVDLANREGVEALVEPWLIPMMGEAAVNDPAILLAMTAMIARQTPASFAGQIKALLDRPDTDAALDLAKRIPTLLIVGREDKWASVAQHEEISARLDGAPLVVIEQAGHMAPAERPKDVAEAMRGFLSA